MTLSKTYQSVFLNGEIVPNEEVNFVDNIKNWTYKLSSTKYNVADTKLKDLLVED